MNDNHDDLGRLIVAGPDDPLPNAATFVDHRYQHDDRALLVSHGGAFYAWDGTCWPEVEPAQLRAALYKFFAETVHIKSTKSGDEEEPFRPNRYSIANLLDALKAETHLPVTVTAPTWLDSDDADDLMDPQDLVVCSNGIVHVPTRTLHELTPALYVHHAVPYAFDPDATAPERWLSFLEELWPDDPESIATLQEIIGYIISGDTRQQKIFMLVGPKRGGKGTIGRVIKALVGDHNVAGPTLAGIGTNFGLSPLISKPLAIVSDARLHGSDSIVTERLLTISGEDTITIDRKYREPWTGKLDARFLILSNELPRLSDSSGALASRFVLLTLTKSFFGQENTRLTDELLEELPSIFNWALDGLARLRARGHFVQPQASRDAVQELEDLGSPVQAFIRDRCVVGSENTIPCDDLYRAWRSWCDDHGRDHPGTAQTFGRDVRAAVLGLKVTRPRDRHGNRYRAYQGVRLREPGELEDETQSRDYIGVDRGPLRTRGLSDGPVRDGPRSGALLSQVHDHPSIRRDNRDGREETAPDITRITDITDSQGGDASSCRRCEGPAERQSAMGTWWCVPCWDHEAGGAA